MAFFTTILSISLLFLQIIVLRAHIKGCQSISDSMELYLPPFSINLRTICSRYVYNSFSIFLINKQMKYNILQSFLDNSLYFFYLLPSTFLLKSDGIYLQSTGLRCRFQLYGYSVQLIIPQDGLLNIEHSTIWVWLSDNLTSVFFSMVLCPNGPLTANPSNWEKRRKEREERKKIKRFFSMRQWIWTIDKCCYTFRNLGGTVQRGILTEIC